VRGEEMVEGLQKDEEKGLSVIKENVFFGKLSNYEKREIHYFLPLYPTVLIQANKGE